MATHRGNVVSVTLARLFTNGTFVRRSARSAFLTFLNFSAICTMQIVSQQIG